MSTASRADSIWAPLRVGIFRALWLAVLVSNIGSWMQTVGASGCWSTSRTPRSWSRWSRRRIWCRTCCSRTSAVSWPIPSIGVGFSWLSRGVWSSRGWRSPS